MESVACEVTVLREKGRRLRKSEYLDPIRGELVIDDWEGTGNSFRRFVRVARVWVRSGVGSYRPELTIFDPVPYKTVKGGFIYGGIELEAQGAETFEHQQMWLVRPILERA